MNRASQGRMSATQGETNAEDDIRGWILEKVSKMLGVAPEDLDIHAPLTEYGIDSRQFVELTADLEELVGRKLPTIVWDNPSIDALARACATQTTR